jgi:putative RecB family exonuclease
LLAATEDVVPYSLRLIYVAGSGHDAVKVLPVNGALIEATEQKMATIWAEIVRAAEEERWVTKKSKLCDWCHFQDLCPAWHPRAEQPVAV